MAKAQKSINIEMVDKEIEEYKNSIVDETELISQAIFDAESKHFRFHMNRKDAGLNVLNHWNLGYNNSQSIKWIENIIKLVNEASNAFVIASNMFTVVNSASPRDCISYEKQIALAVGILSKIKDKPVLLWPGKVERDIYKQTGLDIMQIVAKYLKKNKNVHLVEELDEIKNENDATVFIDLHLDTDFVKNPVITLELRDYKTVSRSVKCAESKMKNKVHQGHSDFIIDLAVLQNAKIFPNFLCVGPVCDEQYVRNFKKTEISLNDSYFKLEIQKNSQKNGQKNARGYTPIALKCDYSFDNKSQAKADRINMTANNIVEDMMDLENGVFYEIMQYFLLKKEENDLERHRAIQDILSKNKEKYGGNKPKKKTTSNKKQIERIINVEESKPEETVIEETEILDV